MTLLYKIFNFILGCFELIFRILDACGRSYTCSVLLT